MDDPWGCPYYFLCEGRIKGEIACHPECAYRRAFDKRLIDRKEKGK